MLFGIKTRIALAPLLLLFQTVPVHADTERTTQEARRDLTNYASIVVGYDLDKRCKVLNPRQRSDYFSHMRLIRHGFQQKGLPDDLLEQIENNARSTGRKQFSTCDREVAELIERLGALTASLGEHTATWLARKKIKRQRSEQRP